MTRIVAVDVETTGFGKNDRIVEIGAVLFDTETNQILAEFESLINPERNIAIEASNVHGLAASDLSLAPVFSELAADLAKFLEADLLIAHNAGFDTRFLIHEFNRAKVDLNLAATECTLAMTGVSLPIACERISYDLDHHSALSDAKACLAVWISGNQQSADVDFLAPETLLIPGNARTLTRSQIGKAPLETRVSGLARLAVSFDEGGADLVYLGLLDSYLRDLQLTDAEVSGLAEFGYEAGITADRQAELREIYLDGLRKAALRDGIITDEEAQLFNRIAAALGSSTTLDPNEARLVMPGTGSLICVTGTAEVAGTLWGKKEMKALIEGIGCQFTDELNKKAGVALLVQDSHGSLSGKVKKAQAWGIPRAVIADFVALATNR